MLLRCGECETFREVTVTNAVAERFDVELDRRAGLVSRAAQALDLERMAEQIETFVDSAAPRLARAGRLRALSRAPRAGFEPAAYSLGGSRSIRLSYRGRRAAGYAARA